MSGDESETPPPAAASPEPPPPPRRGWYRDPANPNYERFWDGQRWSSRRYWGGQGNAGAAGGAPRGPAHPSPSLPGRAWHPSPDAPVQYRGFFDAPLNPRSPARVFGVAVIGLGLGVVYLRLHLFPWRTFAVFFGLALVLGTIGVLARWRYYRDPARQAAIREPVTFETRVWIRFTYAPWYGAYPGLGVARWQLGVRTDSFQITRWVFGNKDNARSTFFSSADAVMWRAIVEGQDCIVVSGPTYNRSRVEFSFAAHDGRNPQAWDALQASGVRVVEAPAPSAPAPPARTEQAPRSFRRIGHDLGTARVPAPAPPQGVASEPAADGRPGLRPPIRGRRMPPVALLVAGALFLLSPFLLGALMRVSSSRTGTVDHVTTTECLLDPARDTVGWSGVLTAHPIALDHAFVMVRVPSGALVGTANVPVPPGTGNRRGTIALGPVSIAVVGTPAAVACTTIPAP